MNANLERALLLYQQSRHDLAEAELRQALTVDPHDAYAHALLALCLVEREQYADATTEAEQAVHLAPDYSFTHYAVARVRYARNHYPEARAAVEEALRLDSNDADYFALLASIHLEERHWQPALEAAERGLQFDPEHVGCTNLRAMAMVKLGRKAEAGATIATALSRHPDNSLTHANQGWTLLEKGDAKAALEHFREAMRLDPGNDWARQGIVEALKARNILYAAMLKYFLWMSKLSPNVQWGIILGGYFGNQLLRRLSESNPDLAPWILPLRILYISFALMTWVADPLFNLMLRLNRFGRHALSREQTIASNWIGASLFIALLGLIGSFLPSIGSPALRTALVFGCLVLPLAGTFKCPQGWPRNVMAIYTACLAIAGIGSVGILLMQVAAGEGSDHLNNAASGLLAMFVIGVVLSMWLVNFLVFKQVRK
jgi:tetratricopeptide (TPR) repeat protein